MENDIRNMIERMKIKAEGFLKANIRAFIIDTNDTYYWCNILSVDENFIYIENFKGVRESEKQKIFWSDITRLDEYKDKSEVRRW